MRRSKYGALFLTPCDSNILTNSKTLGSVIKLLIHFIIYEGRKKVMSKSNYILCEQDYIFRKNINKKNHFTSYLCLLGAKVIFDLMILWPNS